MVQSMCSILKNALLSTDFISPQFSLENKHSNRLHTLQGAFISLLTLVLCLIIFMMLGKEIYLRESPRLSILREDVKTSQINLKSLPIFFSFTSNSSKINVSNIQNYFEPIKIVYEVNEEGKLVETKSEFRFERCNFTIYSTILPDYIMKKVDDLVCITSADSDYISNSLFARNSANINLGFRKCTESYHKCLEGWESIVNTFLVTVYYPNTYINMNNYELPYESKFEEATTQIVSSLFRRFYFRYSYAEIRSDYGWLDENLVSNSTIYLDSVVPDDIGFQPNGTNKDYLFMISLESPLSRLVYSRSYMKIGELLASLGGISNFLIVFVKIITYPYIRYLYLLYIKSCVRESNFLIGDNPKQRDNDIKSVIIPFTAKPSGKNIIGKMTKINLPSSSSPPSEISDIKDKPKLKNQIIQENFNVSAFKRSIQEEIKDYDHIEACNNRSKEEYEKSNYLHFQEDNKQKINGVLQHSSKLNLAHTKSLKISDEPSYLQYVYYIICCNKSKKGVIETKLQIASNIISIQTFCNMVASINGSKLIFEI